MTYIANGTEAKMLLWGQGPKLLLLYLLVPQAGREVHTGLTEPCFTTPITYQISHEAWDLQEYMTYTANGTEAKMLLWGQGPKWEHSTAPLVDSTGSLMQPPLAGRAGHAVRLNGQQVHSLLCSFAELSPS